MTIRSDSAIQALQSVPFFTRLGKREAKLLAQRLIMRRFDSDQIIFHHGDPAGLLYIITSGKVKITHTNPDGQEALLAILGSGDFFGELALLDDSPRSATVEALEATKTLTLHRDEFIRYISDNPNFALHVLKTLAQHIRRMNNQISDIFFLDLPARLARQLLHLAEDHGRVTTDGILIDLSLTQTDLAEMTGTTRVSINKAIGRFRRAGWLESKGRKFLIRDSNALANLIELSGG